MTTKKRVSVGRKLSASSTKQSQKSIKRASLYPKSTQKDQNSLARNSISSSTVSKKVSPKILDSQINTNFYEKSIYKSQLDRQNDEGRRRSKNMTSASFYSK